jgi:hypothetical protein
MPIMPDAALLAARAIRTRIGIIVNGCSISCGLSRNSLAYRRPFVMHAKHRNYSPIEARRCRRAQYRGGKATAMLNGLRFTRMVRSAMEVKSSDPTRWIVSVGLSGCYLVRRRVMTPYCWRLRRVQVCD